MQSFSKSSRQVQDPESRLNQRYAGHCIVCTKALITMALIPFCLFADITVEIILLLSSFSASERLACSEELR